MLPRSADRALLRALIDEARRTHGRFFLLGSISPELVRNISETLAGRAESWSSLLSCFSCFPKWPAGGKSKSRRFGSVASSTPRDWAHLQSGITDKVIDRGVLVYNGTRAFPAGDKIHVVPAAKILTTAAKWQGTCHCEAATRNRARGYLTRTFIRSAGTACSGSSKYSAFSASGG